MLEPPYKPARAPPRCFHGILVVSHTCSTLDALRPFSRSRPIQYSCIMSKVLYNWFNCLCSVVGLVKCYMALNDMYQITLGGDHTLGQQFRAVFFWEQIVAGSPIGDSSVLAPGFDSSVVAYLLDVMSNEWLVNHREVVNLDDPDDYDFSFSPSAGHLAGNSMPPVLAVGFRSPRQAPGVHRARHNLPVGLSSWLSSYGLVSDSDFDSLYFLQQQLGLGFVDGISGASWAPRIVQKHYSGGSFIGYTKRGSAYGQWQTNQVPTTVKSRQGYLWLLADEPV